MITMMVIVTLRTISLITTIISRTNSHPLSIMTSQELPSITITMDLELLYILNSQTSSKELFKI